MNIKNLVTCLFKELRLFFYAIILIGDFMFYVFRLTKGMDLKKSIVKYCRDNNINAGIIGSCVGCCDEVNFRLAGGEKYYYSKKDYEIVSATGTISEDGVHIHISFSDDAGVTIGGHLSDGCIINTTCEVCIIEIDNYKMNRVFDEDTGYNELVVSEITE